MALDYATLKVAGNQEFTAPRRPSVLQATSLGQRFFAHAIQAAESLQRQGIVINAETLHTEAAMLPMSKLRELVALPVWEQALEERGIADHTSPLTPRQMAALAIYMDMSVTRTHQQKLRAADVRQAEWNGWLRQPQFAQYLEDLSSEALQSSVPIARQRIAEGVDRGEKPFIDLMLKMTGNDPDQAIDLQRVLLGIFTILDENIQDASLLKRIGQEVSGLLGGGQGAQMARQMIQLTSSAPAQYPGQETPQAAGEPTATVFPIQEQ